MTFNFNNSLEKILCNLIDIPSVTGNEEELINILNNSFKKNGMMINRYKNNLVVDLNFNKDKTIALIGHVDTVPESKRYQTVSSIKNGNVYGLGACDMKAGLACMIKAAHELNKRIITPRHNLKLVFYDGEEGSFPNGITKLISKNILKGIDFAYVLEPTTAKYGVGCLGSIVAEVEFKGVSAHSANPWHGKNAVYGDALNFISKIEEYENKKQSVQQDVKHSGYIETVNITGVNTKNATNKIPDKVIITLNYRYSPPNTFEDKKKIINSLAIGASKINYVDNALPYHLDTSKYAQFLIKEIPHKASQFWSDMVQLNNAGILAINFGPGNIKYAHSKNEHISISELKSFYNLLKKHV